MTNHPFGIRLRQGVYRPEMHSRVLATAALLALAASAGTAFTVMAPPPEAGPAVVLRDGGIPMHVAVLRAQERFAGRVLDIAAAPPTPSEQAAGIALVYRLRMVTPRHDVLDIRMDARSGRFVEVRGADLGAARRARRSRAGDRR